ncbi:MAG: hypothetical protein WC824_15865 [Bacteroidota bacterium]|jgi:hypothetical protein
MITEDSFPERHRFEQFLFSLADTHGFIFLPPTDLFGPLAQPAFFAMDQTKQQLFLGDIQLTTSDQKSTTLAKQIVALYLMRFKDLMQQGTITGGVITLVTDAPDTREMWDKYLYATAARIELFEQHGMMLNFELAYRDHIWISWGSTDIRFRMFD